MRFAEFKESGRCPAHFEIHGTSYVDQNPAFDPLGKIIHATGYSVADTYRKRALEQRINDLQEKNTDLSRLAQLKAEYNALGTPLAFYYQGRGVPGRHKDRFVPKDEAGIPLDARVIEGLTKENHFDVSSETIKRLVRVARDKGTFSVSFLNMDPRCGAIVKVIRHPSKESRRAGTAICAIPEMYYSPRSILHTDNIAGLLAKSRQEDENGFLWYDLRGRLPTSWKRIPPELANDNKLLNYYLSKYNKNLLKEDKLAGFRERLGTLPVIGRLFKKSG